MTMAPMLYFAAVFVNCLFFAPAVEATTQMSLFSDTILNNFIFTSNVLFESESRSVLDCGRQCSRHVQCVTFTYVTGSSSGSCRGHNATFNSTSDHGATVTGAKTFTKSAAIAAWKYVDGSLKCVSVGDAGVWGVNNNDQVFYRTGTYRKPDEEGTSWELIPGELQQLDVGRKTLWGVNRNDEIYYRIGISSRSPYGSRWQWVDGSLKHVSVSPKGYVWGVNAADDIFVRQGITKETPGGTGWKHIDGKLKQISVGKSGVWGVNAQNQIFYRTGTYDDNGSEGSGLQHVDGSLKYVSSGEKFVISVSANDDIFMRAGISDSKPTGTSWVNVIGKLKVVDARSSNEIWGVNAANDIFHA